MISQILDRLYVGDSDFTNATLNELGITIVINVGGSKEINYFPRVIPHHLSDDGKNEKWKFNAILGKLNAYLTYSHSHKVLVCCRAGISRSCFIVILWLEKMGMSRDDAYEFIKEKHPAAQINNDLMESY